MLRINPKRQVPVLVHGAVEIFDSTQIFEYFEHLRPHPPLWPSDPAARARPAVNQFVRQFADSLARYQLRIPDFIERAAVR